MPMLLYGALLGAAGGYLYAKSKFENKSDASVVVRSSDGSVLVSDVTGSRARLSVDQLPTEMRQVARMMLDNPATSAESLDGFAMELMRLGYSTASATLRGAADARRARLEGVTTAAGAGWDPVVGKALDEANNFFDAANRYQSVGNARAAQQSSLLADNILRNAGIL